MATRDEHGRELPDGVYVDAEPSAPDELARLLPGLAHDLDMVTDLRFESQRSTPIQRVARACSLLLDERERVSAAMRPYHAPTRDEGSYERTLSRVLAELDRLRADDGARLSGIVAKNRELTDALGHAEEDRDALRARVAELEAAPPPGTVATPERVESLSDFIEAAREVIDGAPMSDRSGRTDGDRIAKMARALVSYESAEETHEPAPSREPSAPTDGELARLLPGLAEDVARVRRTDFGSPDSVSASIDRLARACELLLDERERMARAVGISDAMVSRATRDLATASACVAELEAAPAGHRVAALLADLKRMRKEGDGGIREAIEAVREHLTAPSPLDLAVAEVCAVDAAEVADTFDAWAALGDICRAEADGLAEERAQFAKAARVALAGMLACDAADGGKGGA